MAVQEVVPYLNAADANPAVAFYSDVLEIAPHDELTMPDGRMMYCEFRVGNVRFFVRAELPEYGRTPSPTTQGATTVAIHRYVDECNAMVDRMEPHGADVPTRPDDVIWAERFARVRDPFGHEWGVTARLKETAPEEIQALTAKLFEVGPGVDGSDDEQKP